MITWILIDSPYFPRTCAAVEHHPRCTLPFALSLCTDNAKQRKSYLTTLCFSPKFQQYTSFGHKSWMIFRFLNRRGTRERIPPATALSVLRFFLHGVIRVFRGYIFTIMNMVESGNYWEVFANDTVAYEDLDNLLHLLDVEGLEGDDIVGDWDIPIPTDVALGPVEPTCSKIAADVVPKPTVADAGQKQVSNDCDGSSHSPPQNKLAETTQEPGRLETQSPVSVLQNSGSCLTGKSLPIKFRNANTVRARSKRIRLSGSNPWLLVLPWFSSASTFKRTSNTKKNKESQKRLHQSIATQSAKDSSIKVEPQCPIITKKCTHCEVTKTPQWREGPLGPKTLCNACGVRFRSGRLFPEYRPVASPTFVPSLHSNSHRKVMEMRKKVKQQELEIGELSSSSQPDFIPMSSYLFDYN